MGKNYWLHRISHEGEISDFLFNNGYLSLGWSAFSNTNILDLARKEDSAEFEKLYHSKRGDKNRSRWNMWYFARFEIGDIVIVPLPNGMFSVCDVIEKAKPIKEIANEIDFTERFLNISWDNGLLQKDSEKVDLGFVLKTKKVKSNLSRNEYADRVLTSRMKMRQTNGNITDIKQNIDAVINAEKPINFYENALEDVSKSLLSRIRSDLNPHKFEILIKSYMLKIGADNVYIPPKNEHGKTNYADADVLAFFDKLKVIIQIQAKFHEDQTDSWAVEQINEYRKQSEDENSELKITDEEFYRVVPWVISSCDCFSEEAIEKAKIYDVRLVNGIEFAKMLINTGLANLDII